MHSAFGKLLFAFLFAIGTCTSLAAQPLMSKAQYVDYSVQYRCIDQRFHDQPDKKEQALVELDNRFGLNDDNFDAFDELVTSYERDATVVENIIDGARTHCPIENQ